jgi:hypothetical protein
MSARLKNLLLVAVVSLACLAAADWAFRLYERHAFTASYRPEGPVADLQALNYNDSTIPKAKPPAEMRILSFGDSFCHAIVRFPFSYSGVAQQTLTGPDRPARVVNLGEPNSSFMQYLKSAANWSGQIEHDALVVNLFLGNDLSEAASGSIPDDAPVNQALGGNFVDIQTGRKRMNHVPRKFPLRMLDYAYAYWLLHAEGQFVLREVPEPYTLALGPMDETSFARVNAMHLTACDPKNQERLEKGYDQLATLAKYLSGLRQRGEKILILVSPAEVQVSGELLRKTAARLGQAPESFDLDLPNRRVRQTIAAADPDLPVLDLTPLMREAVAAGVNPYYPMETHWNVEGNRIAGEALAAWIKDNWLR